jgi:YHS domain-containing protein
MKRLLLLAATTLIAACGNSEPPVYAESISQTDGVAIGGYDAVAYHTQSEAIVGDPSHTVDWEGATWHFADEENASTFESDPEAYAPAYGGHCAFAYGLGKDEAGDPTLFDVVDGTLYLNSNPVAQLLWSPDEE